MEWGRGTSSTIRIDFHFIIVKLIYKQSNVMRNKTRRKSNLCAGKQELNWYAFLDLHVAISGHG